DAGERQDDAYRRPEARPAYGRTRRPYRMRTERPADRLRQSPDEPVRPRRLVDGLMGVDGRGRLGFHGFASCLIAAAAFHPSGAIGATAPITPGWPSAPLGRRRAEAGHRAGHPAATAVAAATVAATGTRRPAGTRDRARLPVRAGGLGRRRR